MNVFICADIEGVTTTTTWDETNPSHSSYGLHAKQMTEEVLACIRGAKKAGAKQIVVKDAHGPGTNIDPSVMPSGVCLLRGWSGHPDGMVEGIDMSYDAAMFVGHHSAAGKTGSPMAHTYSGRCNYIKINGEFASEFLIYSYACANKRVPTVFLSGDRCLCDDSQNLHPKLVTCPVKDGNGAMTVNYSPADTLKEIAELSEKALTQDLTGALVKLPKFFEVELCFKDHAHAKKVSYFPFPKMKKVSDHIISFTTIDYDEVLRTLVWVL